MKIRKRTTVVSRAEDEGYLDDEETLGFYLYFTEGVNPLPHRNYPRLELDKYTDEECVNTFRFRKTWQLHYVYHTAFYAEMARLLVV